MALSPAQHARARASLLAAWGEFPDVAPTLERVQAVQAVGYLESTYGLGWKGPMTGSWNMGAIQCATAECRAAAAGLRPVDERSWSEALLSPCPPGTAPNSDTHADGARYVACFRRYPSEVAGWAALVRLLLSMRPVRAVLDSGNAWTVARAMKEARYYEGKGTPEQAIATYGAGLSLRAREASEALGERYALGTGPSSTGVLLLGAAALGGAAWWYWGRS